MASATEKKCIATDWLEEDNLMLLECWARDGYTFQDVANRIGIDISTLKAWRVKYPEIDKALKTGREIIDYKVENALLKSALGYRTKETKVITIMRHGKVVETQRETTEKEQAPNISAAQCWLYNRLPKKWKNMNSRSNILDDMDEDTSIHVTVTRASAANRQSANPGSSDADEEWEDEVNSSIEFRKATPEEKEAAEKARRQKKSSKPVNEATKVEPDPEDDLDYWPEDWEDDEEGWEG